MKRYFIADVLTAAKLIPAVCILIFFNQIDSGAVFLLFVFGEVLDALDGMAAKKWPHPKETEKLWFRKNIKLLESGLDLLLAIVALVYVTTKINFWFGVVVFLDGVLIGIVGEFLLYGKLFGTPETAKKGSLFQRSPEKAHIIVGGRLLAYLAGILAIMFALLKNAPWNVLAKGGIAIIGFVVCSIIIDKKIRDGRLDDVKKLFGLK